MLVVRFISSARTWFAFGVLCGLALFGASVLTETASQSQPRYSAEIRRTSHGIPHITAKDMGSLGFGEGYAFAQDHLCSLADQVVKARGERARYFGPGENNRQLNSDIAFRALGIYEQARSMLQSMPKEQREMVEGYVAGYNQYLSEVGANGVAGWCRGKEWVFPITAEDLMAYNQSIVVTSTNFADMIATAAAPKNETARAEQVDIPDFEQASNGWAIGAERSASGRGMLLANPHYPWVGSNRFWEKHLVIPGQLDVYGVGLLGMPGVAIGFNRAVAWTHTVSAGKRFTLYTLDLAPGNPTRYLYDGKEHEMTSKVISVAARQADGSVKQVERRVFFSHYGPVLNFPGFGWTAKRAVTIRDANANNVSSRAQWMAMNRARSLEEFKEAHAKYNAMPWVNTIAASADGRAWYADTSATPNLKPAALAAWLKRRESDPLTRTAWERGLVLLDGSDSLYEWADDPTTRPGVIPYSRMPQLERKDFVAVLSNRSLSAELARGELVKRCMTAPVVTLDGQAVDLRQACGILAAWDGRYETSSVGAALWREFITQYESAELQKDGALWQRAFDPADPVGTPHTLTPDKNGESLLKLARAAQLLAQAGIALDTPLGRVQFSDRNGGRIPIHGGEGGYDGIANFVNYAANGTTLEPEVRPERIKGSRFLTKDGYPVNRGSSFVMALEYTAQGPRAQAFLTYSQSGDPASPLYFDQTELFSAKKWRRILFTEAEIKADPNLKTLKVSGKNGDLRK